MRSFYIEYFTSFVRRILVKKFFNVKKSFAILLRYLIINFFYERIKFFEIVIFRSLQNSLIIFHKWID